MTDLLAEGISAVEDVYKIHEPLPHLKAVYFITPTEQSVDGLLRDFKSKSSYKYKAAYVYFSDFCPDMLFNKIKSCCAKAIRRCKEINISFIPHESQVFTLHVPDVFHSCYSPDVEIETVLDIAAQQIVTLCGSLEENPGVRYKRQPLDNANALANLVEEKLVHYYKTDEEGKVKGKTQSQLLIVDRGFDPVTTVLHELTFQAMAYDLLPIEKDVYRYQTDESNKKEKEAHLDESDELWVKIRHKHIAYVLEEIPRLVKEISSSKKETEAKLSLSSLSQLMKKMPHFRKQLSTQTLHLNIAENCMKKFQNHVEKLCKSEQDLALGTDVEGQKIKDSMRVLLPVLLNKTFDHYDKIRAILLYIFGMNGTTQENLDKLIQHAQIVADSDMIRNWKYLGVPILSSSASQRKPARRDRSQEETFQLSRWTPVIKDVMEDAIENKLDPKEWIYCSECPAAWNGSGAVSARQKYKTSIVDERKNEPKLIIFILGGMTYSEMRCAYEVTQANKSCEVIIGSTHILTPERLLDDVQALSKPKVPQETFSLVTEIKV
ncbi:syntaxin-binding protein 3 isoform X2 [Rhinatrema bivittatum]|nr:syntaxin-binding protein 3 isoform X2 [Rhinatrema bivittatum]XP_029473945.1 syntaxin-binding protein 3 isoform X2 [Rhinatrema bivittatum]